MRASSVRTLTSSARRLQNVEAHSAASSSTAPPEFIAFPEFVHRATAEQEGSDDIPEGAPAVRRSQAAQDGSSRIGMVELPTELLLAVNRLVEGTDKARIRQRALTLYEYFRSTRSTATASRKRDYGDEAGSMSLEKAPSKPFLDGQTALAYTAGLMPSIYAGTLAVLNEARSRFELVAVEDEEPWIPKKIVDWGAGVGSGGWAAQQTWPDSPLAYVGLDSSRSMQAISSSLLAAIPPSSLPRKLHQTSLGAPDLHETISTSFPDIPLSETMALAAYTLGDLPSEKVRREVVRSMWDSGAEVIVVIDRGTPKGFDIVASARDQLLRLGRHQGARKTSSSQAVAAEADEDELVIGGEVFTAEQPRTAEQASPEKGRGCYIVAPCPHDGQCPLHKTKKFCHFSQKIQRPPFLRKTKHSADNEEPSSYSYFVMKRGSRPEADPQWPRLVLPPLKRGGHVILDACCPSTKIERFTVAKSAGKQQYYDARKSRWGDAFPHYDEAKSRTQMHG